MGVAQFAHDAFALAEGCRKSAAAVHVPAGRPARTRLRTTCRTRREAGGMRSRGRSAVRKSGAALLRRGSTLCESARRCRPVDRERQRAKGAYPGTQRLVRGVRDQLDKLVPNLLFALLDAWVHLSPFAEVPCPGSDGRTSCGPYRHRRGPSHGRVVLKSVEPATDERVAGLHLVIQEPEGQARVHGLDPEGKPGKLDSQLVDIDTVEAALNDVPAEVSPQIVVEVGVANGFGDGLIAQPSGGQPVREPDNDAGRLGTSRWW